MDTKYLIYAFIPFVSALVGWLTNYIAVKMIFRPRRPRNICGFKVQGLIPKRQKDLAHNLGETIEKELISHKDVQKILESNEVKTRISSMIEKQVDQFMNEKLASIPMISMFLQGDLAQQIKDMLVKQLNTVIPSFLDTCMKEVEDKLDFKKTVQQKVENFDYVKLEEIVFRIAEKEFKTIEVLGAVLGFFIGLTQVGLLLAFGD